MKKIISYVMILGLISTAVLFPSLRKKLKNQSRKPKVQRYYTRSASIFTQIIPTNELILTDSAKNIEATTTGHYFDQKTFSFIPAKIDLKVDGVDKFNITYKKNELVKLIKIILGQFKPDILKADKYNLLVNEDGSIVSDADIENFINYSLNVNKFFWDKIDIKNSSVFNPGRKKDKNNSQEYYFKTTKAFKNIKACWPINFIEGSGPFDGYYGVSLHKITGLGYRFYRHYLIDFKNSRWQTEVIMPVSVEAVVSLLLNINLMGTQEFIGISYK